MLPLAYLASLPCGCVVDSERVPTAVLKHEGEQIVVLECPWCDATFLMNEFEVWRIDGQGPLFVERKTQLVFFGKTLLEFIRPCGDCTVPLVRERGGVTFHLPVPPRVFSWCGN